MINELATLRKARVGHKCHECGEPILPGTDYYEIVIAGGGLRSLKFPDYVHIDCLTAGITITESRS